MKEEKIKVTGMTCSACANRVERSVKKLMGRKLLSKFDYRKVKHYF